MNRARTFRDIGLAQPGFIDQLAAWGFWLVSALTVGALVAIREGWL